MDYRGRVAGELGVSSVAGGMMAIDRCQSPSNIGRIGAGALTCGRGSRSDPLKLDIARFRPIGDTIDV